MQSKGIVKFFLVLLTMICAGQFIYMFPTNRIEKKGRALAAEAAMKVEPEKREAAEKEAYVKYLDAVSSETALTIPLIGKYSYQDCKAKQLALGLDLKGGMSVLLKVDLSDFLTILSNKSTDPSFTTALAAATAEQKSTQGDLIQLFAKEFKKSGKSMASVFMRNDALKGAGVNLNSSDDYVVQIIRDKANDQVKETFERLKTRIDKLGVVQPNVSLDKARDIIMVELPGFENPERAREFLTRSANLQFWEMYRTGDDNLLGKLQEADNLLKGDATIAASTDTGSLKRGPLVSMLNITPFEPRAPEGFAVVGSADKNKRDTILTYLKRPAVAALFPQDLVWAWSKDASKSNDKAGSPSYQLYALKKTLGKDGAAIEGEHVTDAREDQGTGKVGVSLKMDNTGASVWRDLTTRAANDKQRNVAVVLDDQVVSAPNVINPITEGNTSITGSYTVQEAQDFASILQVGKLPAKLTIISETNVGPSLGAENIHRSVIALVVALLSIIVFMGLYYSSGGVVAIVALLANLFFIIGALTSLGTVLTLPGIAGIVLTMGIAVDANVIVYERIREELAAGKGLAQAIQDGFKHAMPAIIDGNLTNMISAFVLGIFAVGAVKGFAVVLGIGVAFTLFTALIVSRLMIEYWTDTKGHDLKFASSWSDNLFKGIDIDWMKMRYKTYIISCGFILAGLGAFFVRGFDLGVDFRGGYSYNVQFDKSKAINVDELKNTLSKSFDNKSTIVKSVSTSNTFNITTAYLVDDNTSAAQDNVTGKLYAGLKLMGLTTSDSVGAFKNTSSTGTHLTSFSKVGSMVADDIKGNSVWANVIALALIFLYILIRFKKWQYSLGAVIALFHDVLFILACFTLFHGFLPFSLEVDQAIVAAVLTISAYSMNDTVIVYDRIREYAQTYSSLPMKDIINKAINSTLSRTIITSAIVLMVVLILFLFGGSSIKGFAFALIIGVLVGTYSSIFIASPIMLDLTKNLNLSDTGSVSSSVAGEVVKTEKKKATA
jgi:SecD/SecF fusion protein